MITNWIISGVCLFIAIMLFLSYNSGLGGALSSLKKRLTYIFAILFFIAFIFFLNKGYYLSDNQQNKQLTKELVKEYFVLEKEIRLNKSLSNSNIQERQFKVRALIQRLDSDTNKEYDTYFSILINILSAFIGWVIVFTFRNRLLG
jgi:hypothetical protein